MRRISNYGNCQTIWTASLTIPFYYLNRSSSQCYLLYSLHNLMSLSQITEKTKISTGRDIHLKLTSHAQACCSTFTKITFTDEFVVFFKYPSLWYCFWIQFYRFTNTSIRIFLSFNFSNLYSQIRHIYAVFLNDLTILF